MFIIGHEWFTLNTIDWAPLFDQFLLFLLMQLRKLILLKPIHIEWIPMAWAYWLQTSTEIPGGNEIKYLNKYPETIHRHTEM